MGPRQKRIIGAKYLQEIGSSKRKRERERELRRLEERSVGRCIIDTRVPQEMGSKEFNNLWLIVERVPVNLADVVGGWNTKNNHLYMYTVQPQLKIKLI